MKQLLVWNYRFILKRTIYTTIPVSLYLIAGILSNRTTRITVTSCYKVLRTCLHSRMSEKRKTISLEDCIKKSRVEVEIDEKMITIERKRYTEIKDGTEPNIGEYAINQLNNDTQLDYEAKFWKGKCAKLIDERNNLEKQLLNKLGAVLQKYEHLRDYSKQLEKISSDDSSCNTDQSYLKAEIETAMKKIHVYETLTSMKITATDGTRSGSEGEHICTITNPSERIGSVFSINFQNPSNTTNINTSNSTTTTKNNTTSPTTTIQVAPKANPRYLPVYLQDGEILCEQSSAPYLLKDILQNLFGDQDNTNNSTDNTNSSTTTNNTNHTISNAHNSIDNNIDNTIENTEIDQTTINK